MSALSDETLLTMSAAAKELPSRPHASTIQRWVQYGIKGIRLETLRIGGRRYTSREAVQRFIQKLSSSDSPSTVQSAAAPPEVSQRDQRIESQLDALGI